MCYLLEGDNVAGKYKAAGNYKMLQQRYIFVRGQVPDINVA